MSNKFTNKAITALKFAKCAAREQNSPYISVEHIFLGITNTECAASVILKNFGYEKNAECKDFINETKLDLERLPYSIKANMILENAINIARKNKTELAGSEHILYSILTDGSLNEKIFKDPITINNAKIKIEKLIIEEGKNTDSSSALQKYGKDLTLAAQIGEIDEVYGRENEIKQVETVLLCRKKNNPCLVGPAGVGKTAIAEGFSLLCAKGETADKLKDARIYSVDLASMVAGAKYRGEFEERIKNITDEAEKDRSIILFIDEIHTIIGAGSAEGALDASNILKPALADGRIRVIGATTEKEYKKYIESDPALERRFRKIEVKEPSLEKTKDILLSMKDKLEDHHNVQIPDIVIIRTVKLTAEYFPERNFPDKAIDLLDEASAMKARENNGKNVSIDIMTCISKGEYKKALDSFENGGRNRTVILSEHDIINTISEKTGISADHIVGKGKAFKLIADIADKEQEKLRKYSSSAHSVVSFSIHAKEKNVIDSIITDLKSASSLDDISFIDLANIKQSIAKELIKLSEDNKTPIVVISNCEKAQLTTQSILAEILKKKKIEADDGKSFYFKGYSFIFLLSQRVAMGFSNENKPSSSLLKELIDAIDCKIEL